MGPSYCFELPLIPWYRGQIDIETTVNETAYVKCIGLSSKRTSLHMLDIRFMKEGETQFEFLLPEHIKQSRPGYKPPSVMLKAYPTDKTLCVVSHMKEYLRRTKPLRGDSTKLFISFMKPHKHISRETLSRWIKTVMEAAGKETSIFHTHSTRAAATSKAKAACVTIQEILDTAGWSSSKTFDRFYNKRASNELTFTNSLLKRD